jgi:class 3 adenylate cyclase
MKAKGATEDELERINDDDDLYALAGDLVRRKDIEWVSIESVAEAAGVSVEEVRRYRLLVGLPPNETLVPAWTVVGLRDYLLAAAFSGEEGARDYVRVLAAAVARVTAAATGVFLNDVAPRLRASEVPPAEAVELVEAMSSALLVHTPEAFDLLFREHTLLGARRGRLEHEADQARVAIGFVDLAGSTAWAERVTHAEHAAALSRFEDAAWSAASSRGARVVKMIGDARRDCCLVYRHSRSYARQARRDDRASLNRPEGSGRTMRLRRPIVEAPAPYCTLQVGHSEGKTQLCLWHHDAARSALFRASHRHLRANHYHQVPERGSRPRRRPKLGVSRCSGLRCAEPCTRPLTRSRTQ